MGRQRNSQAPWGRWRLRVWVAIAAAIVGAVALTAGQAIAALAPPAASARPSVEISTVQPGAVSPALRATVRKTLAEEAHFTGTPSVPGTLAQPAQAVAPAQCRFTLYPLYAPHPSRVISCSSHTNVIVVLSPEGDVLGSFTLVNLQWTTYSPSFGGWVHGMLTVAGKTGSGVAEDGVTATVSSACDRVPQVCDAINASGTEPQTVFIAPESFHTFLWLEFDNGPAASKTKQVDVLNRYLGVDVYVTAGGGSRSFADTGQLAGRCDSVVTARDGCVDQDFTPTLELPIATYGSAAAMIAWAQDHLNGAWGLASRDKPLTYYPMGNAHREVVCNMSGDGKFVTLGKAIGGNDGSTDSCDEYPFASSGQSAAEHGVKNGGECAQVEAYEPHPVNEPHGRKYLAKDWSAVMPIGTYSKDALCVRGHIPSALNSLVGTAFSKLITAQRLLGPSSPKEVESGDTFFVRVS